MQRFDGARLGTIVVLLAPVLAGLLVWRTSAAAFSGTTVNAASAVSSGTVTLTDDDAATSLFTASDLRPGSTGQRCIAVTYAGTLAASVRLYASSVSSTNSLSTYLNLQIEEGSGGGFGSCAGFSPSSSIHNGTLASFASARTSFATGISSWGPAAAPPSTARTFRITYTLVDTAPSGAASGTASVALTWEAQNL